MNGKEYKLDIDNRINMEAYRSREGKDLLGLVCKDVKECQMLRLVMGKLQSSYQFYNQIEDENEECSADDEDSNLLKWCKNNRMRHPECTMFVRGCNTTTDYIFYTPQTMIVKKLLNVPRLSELSQ